MEDEIITCYFNKEWNEVKEQVKFKGTIYYALSYPLDLEESDTIVIRVYTCPNYKDEECGNGVWTDTGKGVVSGNDELYFEGLNELETNDLECEIFNKVFSRLKQEGVI